MNKFFLFGILLFVFASSSAQTQTEKEIRGLLCHKWTVTHFEIQGQKTPMPAEFSDNFLDIKPDGTIIEKDPTEEIKGKWSYDHKTMTFTTDDKDGIIKHEIIKISETELIFKSELEGTLVNLIMKRVD